VLLCGPLSFALWRGGITGYVQKSLCTEVPAPMYMRVSPEGHAEGWFLFLTISPETIAALRQVSHLRHVPVDVRLCLARRQQV